MAYALIKTINEAAGVLYSQYEPSAIKAEIWSQENQANNTSDVTVKIFLNVTSASYDYSIPCFGFIAGTYYTANRSFTGNGSYQVIYQFTKLAIPHEADGTKEVEIAAFVDTGMNSTVGDITLVGAFHDLPDIPRNSILNNITPSTFIVEGGYSDLYPLVACVINYTVYTSSYYNYFAIKIGETTVATRGLTGSGTGSSGFFVTFTSEELSTIYTAMTAANSATFTVELSTYTDSGMGTQVGSTDTITATGTISSTGRAPTFTASNISYQDTNAATLALTDSDSKIIKGYSNIAISVDTTATANKSATLGTDAYLFDVEGQTQQKADQPSPFSAITKTFNGMSKDIFTVTAQDSRGNTTPVIVDLDTNFIDYSPPVITAVSALRDNDFDTDTKLSYSGYIDVVDFGTVENAIESVTYKYKKKTAESYTDGTTDIETAVSYNATTGEFSFTADYIYGDEGVDGADGFDSDFSYDIQVIVTDKVTSYTFTTEIKSGIPMLVKDKVYDTATGAFVEYIFGFGKVPAEGRTIDAAGKIFAAGYECLTSNDIINDLTTGGTGDALSAEQGKMLAGIILYDDATGSNSSVTLSETAANFDYIDIFYWTGSVNNYGSGYIRLFDPDGKTARMSLFTYADSSMYNTMALATISGTGITINDSYRIRWLTTPATTITANTNQVYINRVVGYKV